MRGKKTVLVLVMLSIQLALAGPATAETGRQTFVLLEPQGGDGIRVTAAGAIRGLGVVVVGSEEWDEETGQIIASDRFQFSETDAVEVTYRISLTSDPTIDPRTCVGRHGGDMEWEITGGTGRYAGATGSGTGKFFVVNVAGRNPDGSCSESQEDELAHVFFGRLGGTATVPVHRAA